MRVIADLHIHSRFSRATGKKLTPGYLDRWARIKGIGLLGAGDCTHPQWLAELREQLEEREPGLYALKERVRTEFDRGPALAEGLPTPAGDFLRFVLTGEISTIYKKGNAVRKVHHLIILPDFKAAASFQTRLEREGGNIRSDGRPILGIDSHDLLAMLLDTDERSLLIPAHIWTPWFSALGAQSGFDSIDECYGGLASRIPAVETGLSSNPPMNWALAALDRFAVVSNSDAHSPEKLGREATVFMMDLDYPSLYEALWSAGVSASDSARPAVPLRGNGENRIVETIEFFPQEGKYHYDGHRNCGVYRNPQEAAASGGICPVCGKPMTRGVMGRVMELADRPVDETAPCPPEPRAAANQRPYRSLIPLPELLGELLEIGVTSKKVKAAYGALIEKAGSEFAVLLDMSAGDIAGLRCPGLSGELLAAAVARMRRGDVSITPGYDGEYGIIRAFPPGGKNRSWGEPDLFGGPDGFTPSQANPGPGMEGAVSTGAAQEGKTHRGNEEAPPQVQPAAKGEPARFGAAGFPLDRDQEAAVSYNGRYAVIIAGPGMGKTAAIAARIARLIYEGRDPASILALSFTVKAAAELGERIARMVSEKASARITAATFHSLCCALLREQSANASAAASANAAAGAPGRFSVLSESGRDGILEEILKAAPGKPGLRLQGLGKYIESRKRFLLQPGEHLPRLGGREEAASPFLASLPELAGTFGLGKANPEKEALYGLYRQRLAEKALLDFDDLITETVRLLAGNPALLSKYRNRYRCILVDEYQDVNFAQYVLVRLLAPNVKEAGNETAFQELRVIGDPNQAIYGFRGADKRFLDRFTEDYPGAETFYLSRSFRCAGPIITAAGRLTGSRLAGTDQAVRLFRAGYPTEKSEAEGIARRIARLIGGTSFFALDSKVAGRNTDTAEKTPEEGPAHGLTSLGECAVLIRAGALASPLTKALRDHGIPFDVTEERPWWEEEPVKTVLGRLREQPGRYAGQSPAEAVQTAWEKADRDGVLKAALKGRGKRGNAGEDAWYAGRLRALAGMYGSLGEFLDTLAVSESGDAGPVKQEAVRVMTIHASKGLEFDHVFVAGLEEGILPFTLYDGGAAGAGAADRTAEERRLLYVAMTRARRGLYLSWARTRMLG
ncbi:MAG: UvrD-helicase domain-containing protein, partial [Spirochaetaceae bacterium]|nr:UvrD-helicase domain-containing protein [Spirochaetaceae bacterium]